MHDMVRNFTAFSENKETYVFSTFTVFLATGLIIISCAQMCIHAPGTVVQYDLHFCNGSYFSVLYFPTRDSVSGYAVI